MKVLVLEDREMDELIGQRHNPQSFTIKRRKTISRPKSEACITNLSNVYLFLGRKATITVFQISLFVRI